MVRSAICIAFLFGIRFGQAGQSSASSEPAKITLTLPSNIRSEAVQINYFMAGTFGGAGDFVRAQKGKSSYDILASVDGKLATNLKIIAYMPGCEIVTLDIAIGQPTPPQLLKCKRLETTSLRGQIQPASITRNHEHAEIEVSYLAEWDHDFFGFVDGMVTSIPLGTAVPDPSGQFEISVPDFGRQANLGKGVLEVILRDSITTNRIAFLKPTTEGAESYGVTVRAQYPALIQFHATEP